MTWDAFWEDRTHRLRRIQLKKQGKNHREINRIFEDEEKARKAREKQRRITLNVQTKNVELSRQLVSTRKLLENSEEMVKTRDLELEYHHIESERLLNKSKKTIQKFRKIERFEQEVKKFSRFVREQIEIGKENISFKIGVIKHPYGKVEIEKVIAEGYGEIPVEVYNAFVYANFDELFVKPILKLIEDVLKVT